MRHYLKTKLLKGWKCWLALIWSLKVLNYHNVPWNCSNILISLKKKKKKEAICFSAQRNKCMPHLQIRISLYSFYWLNNHLWGSAYMKRMVGIESPSKRDTPSQTTEGPHLLNPETAINADYNILQWRIVKVHLKQTFYCWEDSLHRHLGEGRFLRQGITL